MKDFDKLGIWLSLRFVNSYLDRKFAYPFLIFLLRPSDIIMLMMKLVG